MASVAVRARAPDGGVGEVADGLADHGEHRLAVAHQGDGHAPLRHPVHVVDGALYRVHDPPLTWRQRRGLHLLAHPARRGPQARQFRAQVAEHEFLGMFPGGGHVRAAARPGIGRELGQQPVAGRRGRLDDRGKQIRVRACPPVPPRSTWSPAPIS